VSGQATFDEYRDDLAKTARDRGASNALWSSRDWADVAQLVLDDLIESGRRFTSEDVRLIVGPAPTPGAEGALVLKAAKAKRIEAVGFTRSQRPARHSGVLRIWRGVSPP
jgi:hypothetical protein